MKATVLSHLHTDISLETQLLQLIVFALRYIDVLFVWISPYNTLLKLYSILASALTVALVRSRSAGANHSPKRAHRILPACVFLALFFNYSLTPTEIAWSCSQFLHALAFVPQFEVLARAADTAEPDRGIVAYLTLVFAWRALYIPHWILR